MPCNVDPYVPVMGLLDDCSSTNKSSVVIKNCSNVVKADVCL